MRFLKSRSLVFKMAVFREWHAGLVAAVGAFCSVELGGG